MVKRIYEYHDPTIGDSVGLWDIGNARKVYVGQTFTVGTIGTNENFIIEEIDCKVRSNNRNVLSGANIMLEIREATTSPGSNILCSGSLSGASVLSGSAVFVACTDLDRNITLNSSTKYAVVLYCDSVTATNYYSWDGQSTGTYTGGSSWADEGNKGMTWTDTTASNVEDLAFKVFGEQWTGTMCTYEDVINKVGAGADSTAKSVTNVSNYAKQAESQLNVLTKKNWTDIYSTLNEDFKYVINEVISSLAAIKVINYSVSGYNSRLEAESMISTLRANAERGIAALRDDNIKTFIENG